MNSTSQAAAAGKTGSTTETVAPERTLTPRCPACGAVAQGRSLESWGRHALFACTGCDLHFWDPREMPDARWYEQMYGGRDARLMPLEPGHKYFLSDPLAPGSGELLDIGCGTGNFLRAARTAGYNVTGTELDGKAAAFARERLKSVRVFPLTISEFASRIGTERFDVVTFFEVLEHQAAPVEFLQDARRSLRNRGYVALSVPNRERWLTGPDVFDYPPNHFLRWNANALKKLLEGQGFEILAIREQAAGIRHAAQAINMRLRTGLMRRAGGEAGASFREVMQMPAEEASKALDAAPASGQRAMQMLGRVKHAACFPLAVAAVPYVRLRGYKGTYLYCLARLRD